MAEPTWDTYTLVKILVQRYPELDNWDLSNLPERLAKDLVAAATMDAVAAVINDLEDLNTMIHAKDAVEVITRGR